jgi:ECF transporter S component (folate family)
MQKKEENQKKSIITTKQIAFMAVMTALSIVLGKFLAINVTEMIRIGLENLPIILVAAILGPFRAAMVALVADLLGCVLRGYTINPVVTLGACAFALICGFLFKQIKTPVTVARLTASVLPAHLVASVVIKTIGLASFYLANYDIGFGTLFFVRLAVYILTAIVEIFIVSFVLKSKAINNQIRKMQKGE